MTPTTAVPIESAITHDRSYVDWAAILAGTVIATAITLVLTGFGSAVGLSMTSPFAGKGFSGMAIAVAIGLWVIWVAVTSLMAGSYVTGRMRRRAGDASAHEVSIRDGAHGLVVWALSALVGAIIATMSVAGAAKTGAEIARSGMSAATIVVGNATEYAIDALVRTETQNPAIDDNTREQIGRVLVRAAADGQLSAQDRTYLTRTIATRAGVEPAEVEKRINAFSAEAKMAIERTRAAAENARRVGILIAFLTAASLAVAAAGAWWGASLGGKHRDENIDLSHLMRW
jgi:FtsH-binding integral membrane protein